MKIVNRMTSNSIAFSLVMVIFLAIFSKVYAIPQFAKKYKTACNTCHVAVPKLNPFGEKFRMNSYQLPGTMETSPVWQQELLPLSGMPHPMYMVRNIENNMNMETPTGIPEGEKLQVNTFRAAFEFFSGGTVGPHLSYLAFLEIEIEPSVSKEGDEEAGDDHLSRVSTDYTTEEEVAAIGTEMSVIFHQLFISYSNIASIWGENIGNLSLRMGFFHLETPFNSLRKLTGHSSPYLAYSLSPVKGGFSLSRRQLGIAASGWLGSMRLGIEYELAAVNGTNNRIDTNAAKDFYGRFAINWRERLRVGLLGYRGWQNILGGSNLKRHDDFFYRLGLDISLQFRSGMNIFGQWIRGYDDDTDAETSGNQEFQFDGVFLEADVPLRKLTPHGSLLQKLMIVGRVDLVSVSKQIDVGNLSAMSGGEDQIRMYTLALRYYFMPNVFLVLEGGLQDNMIGYPEMAGGKAGRVVDVDANWLMAMFVLAF